MLRFLTAGETHGPQLTAIIEGMPSHVPIDVDMINTQLARRQKGYGRGKRMAIEQDVVDIVGGVRHGKTTGAPIALIVHNRDWKNWASIMDARPLPEDATITGKRRVHRPRPGHADLSGGIKYNERDLRNILERSSARETTVRVAIGALVRQMLSLCGVELLGYVRQIGDVVVSDASVDRPLNELRDVTERSAVRVADAHAEEAMIALIDEAKASGDTLGGIVETVAHGLPIGLGAHVQWDRKLDGRIAQAVVSIQAFKGVEFGLGFGCASRRGSHVHDPIYYDEEQHFYRKTNRSGGVEGGMTTGAPLVVRGVMKPISTLYKPLPSVDIDTKEAFSAQVERSDTCAVPAASVIMEHVIAWEIACAWMEKFGGDSIEEVQRNVNGYIAQVRSY
jgi:chorismate synthase